MAEHYRGQYVVAGVTPQQPPIVVEWAARFARQFGAVLVCAQVEADHYVVKEHPDVTAGRWFEPLERTRRSRNEGAQQQRHYRLEKCSS